ncbi:MAG: hypothetical protein ACLFN5_05120 [bacterium]
MKTTMDPSPSRAEITEAYCDLLTLEQRVYSLLRQKEPPSLETLEDIFKKQSRIIEQIGKTPEINKQMLAEQDSEAYRNLQDFYKLREENKEILVDIRDEFKKKIEALDQSKKIMRHYLQGGMRDEEKSSLRIDENR